MNKRFLQLNVFENRHHTLIEETLIPFYGYHGAQQFIRENPICSVYTYFGYTLKFEPTCLGVGQEIFIDIIFGLKALRSVNF